MSVTQRVRKNRSHLNRQSRVHSMVKNRLQAVEIPKVRGRTPKMAAVEKGLEIQDVCLMTNVQPISVLPKWAQWLVRFIYFRYGWAAMAKDDKGMYFSVEYRGVTPDEGEARFFTSEENSSYMKVPWRSCLSVSTGQYSTHDFPLSDASHKYRKRELPFIQVRRHELELLEAKIEQVARSAST